MNDANELFSLDWLLVEFCGAYYIDMLFGHGTHKSWRERVSLCKNLCVWVCGNQNHTNKNNQINIRNRNKIHETIMKWNEKRISCGNAWIACRKFFTITRVSECTRAQIWLGLYFKIVCVFNCVREKHEHSALLNSETNDIDVKRNEMNYIWYGTYVNENKTKLAHRISTTDLESIDSIFETQDNVYTKKPTINCRIFYKNSRNNSVFVLQLDGFPRCPSEILGKNHF